MMYCPWSSMGTASSHRWETTWRPFLFLSFARLIVGVPREHLPESDS